MNFKRLSQSFIDAGHGFGYAWKNEQNFRLQILIALLVVWGMVLFPLRDWEIIILVIFITMVLIMELVNTVVEKFADLLKPRLNIQILLVKDIMSAAVLLTAFGAVVVGVKIFFPHLVNLFK